jgi:hypothetical protein
MNASIRSANAWPGGDRDAVEAAIVAYARQIVDVEWPAMDLVLAEIDSENGILGINP